MDRHHGPPCHEIQRRASSCSASKGSTKRRSPFCAQTARAITNGRWSDLSSKKQCSAEYVLKPSSQAGRFVSFRAAETVFIADDKQRLVRTRVRVCVRARVGLFVCAFVRSMWFLFACVVRRPSQTRCIRQLYRTLVDFQCLREDAIAKPKANATSVETFMQELLRVRWVHTPSPLVKYCWCLSKGCAAASLA